MSKLLTSLFVIIHDDVVIAHGFSVKELFLQFDLQLGSKMKIEEFNRLLAYANKRHREKASFSFIFRNTQYKFQQLNKGEL